MKIMSKKVVSIHLKIVDRKTNWMLNNETKKWGLYEYLSEFAVCMEWIKEKHWAKMYIWVKFIYILALLFKLIQLTLVAKKYLISPIFNVEI